MDLTNLKQADYLDILFDARNKNYGSYQLRKYYGNRLGKAVAILYSIIATLILLAVFKKGKEVVEQQIFDVPVKPTIFDPITPVVPPPKPLQPTPPPPPAAHTRALVDDPIITDDPIPDDHRMTRQDDMHNSVSGTSNTSDSTDISIGAPGGDKRRTTIPEEYKPEPPRFMVGQMPTFDGDVSAYLASHVHYPELAREAGIEGRVGIQFVVNEDGSVSDVTVMKGIGGGCDEEAARVVAGMPKWRAGKHNGVPVKVYFRLAVKFQLE